MPARRTAASVGADGSPLPDGAKEKLTFGCAFPGCGQTYSRMEYLKRHQRKHQDERPFQCKDCSKAFARSDVLLRHRRRCHPTPPPRDDRSQSPLPPPRAHPSVPISSSRTSEREASPLRGAARKHARNSVGSSHSEHPSSRPRLSPDGPSDDDDDRYGSRFSRNGMGNGGVFGVANYYNGSSGVAADTSYASHLLPMFQNTNNAYHNVNDPNHLEDASVLLSMAYPGGVPGATSSTDNAESTSRVDWDSSNAINMIMEPTASETAAAVAAAANAAASVASDNDASDSRGSHFNSGAVDTPARPAAPGAVLPESMGDFEGTMNWLAGATAVQGAADDPATWNISSEPRPLSPLNMSALLSNSPFGLSMGLGTNTSLLGNDTTTAMAIAATTGVNGAATNNNGEDDQTVAQTVNSNQMFVTNAVVKSILDQLALNDVPETRANPNPERPLLRLASQDLVHRSGDEIPRNTRFWLPSDRFAGCYQIPHWALPPLRTLSVMAARTYYTVLNHFSFVHEPTFQLIDTAACLAFAICTVGGLRTGATAMQRKGGDLTGSLHSASSPTIGLWEGVFTDYSVGVDPEQEEDKRRLEEWEAGQIVRHEKTNMLVKSFSLAQGVLMTEYNVALLQALILYHAPYFLSQYEHERRHANMFLGTIVNITRQIGFFQPTLEHVEVAIQAPVVPYTPADLDKSWKRWIQLESRRRTAFLVYQLDTISSLESSVPPIVTPSEVAAIPLPAPNSLWKATTAKDWYRQLQGYRPMTLDEAIRRTFNLPVLGPFDELIRGVDAQPNRLNEIEYGPFARMVIIMTILRGIIEVGEGKRDHGDWRDLTDLWVSAADLRPTTKCLSGDGVDLGAPTRDAIKERFGLALQRWLEGWDSDSQCVPTTASISPGPTLLSTPSLGSASSPGSDQTHAPVKPKGKLVYCEEAMPFYYLAHALLGMLPSTAAVPGHNAFANVRYGDLLDASRTLARASESASPVTQPMF